jgi:hypothetical protein
MIFLLVCDITAVAAAAFFFSDRLKRTEVIAYIVCYLLHMAAGTLNGILLYKDLKRKDSRVLHVLVPYGFSLLFLIPVQWLILTVYIAKSVKKTPGRKWPFYISLFLLLCSIALNFYIARFDTSEFRGLGFLFVHMFLITPVLAGVPLLLRILSEKRYKDYILRVLYAILFFLVLSWIIFLAR